MKWCRGGVWGGEAPPGISVTRALPPGAVWGSILTPQGPQNTSKDPPKASLKFLASLVTPDFGPRRAQTSWTPIPASTKILDPDFAFHRKWRGLIRAIAPDYSPNHHIFDKTRVVKESIFARMQANVFISFSEDHTLRFWHQSAFNATPC